jgi:iron complex outermembrane recepter protein
MKTDYVWLKGKVVFIYSLFAFNYRGFRRWIPIHLILMFPCFSFGQITGVQQLKAMSMEDLMNIEVMTVSRHAEKLREAASAIQVITRSDILSSGAKTLVEALRLAPNLQVAQVNSSQWAVSARGFNNVLANKLLVLIDGRTVYTPLYAGVFWDVQNVLLEDVERIEVISGPGGTLWGANAVNGVINIITRNSKETEGIFLEGAGGNTMPLALGLHYGGKIGDKFHYRVYGTGYQMESMADTSHNDAGDEWQMLQGGLRLDWDLSEKNTLSLQSNIYNGNPNPDGGDTSVTARGDNITARWNFNLSGKCNFQLQAYYDHTWRDFGNKFTEDLKTYDVDYQNSILIGKRHTATYGLGFRLMNHVVTNLELFRFEPADKTLYLYSGFVQDRIMIVNERLYFTLGLKVEHNSYTDFEYQPNVRIAYTPSAKHTIWAAVSRAIRTPARIDREFVLYLAPAFPFIIGNDTFASEDVIAYESGWRLQPLKNLSVSIAGFYNIYNNIRSVEPGPPPFNLPVTFGNGVEGETYGIELSAMNQINDWWSVRGGYTFVKKELGVKPESKDMNEATAESNDPEHQALIQSKITFLKRFDLGVVFRYVERLPDPFVSSYEEIDVRVAFRIGKLMELSVTGQNLLHDHHIEFIPSSPEPREIERSFYGKVICRF